MNNIKNNFKDCVHNWKLHVDVEHCGGPMAGNSIFLCEKCGKFVTLLEKCALDQTSAQEKSLTLQERYTKTGMWANIISASVLIVGVLTLLFGNKIL